MKTLQFQKFLGVAAAFSERVLPVTYADRIACNGRPLHTIVIAALVWLLCFVSGARGELIYVSDSDPTVPNATTNGVIVIDSEKPELINRIRIPVANPAGLALNAITRRGYVASSPNIIVFDLDTNVPVGSPINNVVGNLGHIAINDQTNLLYVGRYFGPLSVVNTAETTPTIMTVEIGGSYFLRVVKPTNKVYGHQNAVINEFDGATQTVTNRFDLGPTNNNEMDYASRVNKLFIADGSSDRVHAISLASGLNSVIRLGNAPINGQTPSGLAYDSGANRVIVSTVSGGLFAIDATTEQVVDSVQAPDVLTEIRISPTTRRIYGTSGTKVYMFDADSLASAGVLTGFVRAYTLEVLPAQPVITSISPAFAPSGTVVTISGEHFGSRPGAVSFDLTDIAIYRSWSDTQVVTTVPDGPPGQKLVSVTTDTGTSNRFPFYAGWRWPVSVKDTNIRRLIFQSYAEWDSIHSVNKRHHTGLDIGVGIDTPVVATAPGTVVLLQRNWGGKDSKTCGKKGIAIPNQNCGDHGDGNMLILQHCIGTCDSPIYSQYAHLNSFDFELEEEIKNKCAKENASGTLLCPKLPTGEYPVSVNNTPSIAKSGKSGFGNNTSWGSHLHFEIRGFAEAALRPPFPKKPMDTDPEYGYTTNHPDLSGFFDPIALIEGASSAMDMLSELPQETITVIRPTTKLIGPANDYKCLSKINPFCAAVENTVLLFQRFIALRKSPPTDGCSLGWYQIAKSTFDSTQFGSGVDVTNTYFSKGEITKDGCIPATWVCQGNDNIRWLAVSPETQTATASSPFCK